MIKIDIVNHVSEKTGLNKDKANVAVESLLQAMKEALLRGERIELRGFGVFAVKNRKTGPGRNPRTGEVVPIQPGKTVRFKPGLELKASKDKSK
jgi:DNA-binding protein HU-beta